MPQSFTSIYIYWVSYSGKYCMSNIADNYVITFVIFQILDSKLKELQGILKTTMLELFLCLVSLNKEGNNSSNYM